jgi:DNA-binding LacI/PurR family transcriptional regulator
MALNNDPKVRWETAKKVLAVVKAQQYRLNGLARRFARGRSNLIGLMVSDIKNPFYAELARGIEAIITGPDDMSTAVECLEGYLQAMKKNRITIKKNFIQHVNFSRREGFKAAMKILTEKDRPEAVFGGNDYIAMGIMDPGILDS